MKIPALVNVSSPRGAPMGRMGHIDPQDSDFLIKFNLVKVRLDSGGYDSGGAYWGLGLPLYRAHGFGPRFKQAQEMFFRAADREAAKAIVKATFYNAIFYR